MRRRATYFWLGSESQLGIASCVVPPDCGQVAPGMPSSRDSFRRNRVAPVGNAILPLPLAGRRLLLRRKARTGHSNPSKTSMPGHPAGSNARWVDNGLSYRNRDRPWRANGRIDVGAGIPDPKLSLAALNIGRKRTEVGERNVSRAWASCSALIKPFQGLQLRRWRWSRWWGAGAPRMCIPPRARSRQTTKRISR